MPKYLLILIVIVFPASVTGWMWQARHPAAPVLPDMFTDRMELAARFTPFVSPQADKLCQQRVPMQLTAG